MSSDSVVASVWITGIVGLASITGILGYFIYKMAK